MKRRSLTHEAVDGIAWQSFAIGANIILRTIILIILTRTLDPEDFGIIAAAMVIISVTTVLSEIGVARVLVQRLTLTPGIEKSAFAISILMGIGASLLIYFTAPLSARLFEMDKLVPYVEFLSLVLVINAVSIIAESLIQRARRFRAMGLIELGSFLAGFGFVALPLAQSGYGAWSLAIGYFVQCVVKLVALLFAHPPKIGLWPREGTRELVTTGAGFMVGQVGNFVARQIDYLIVGRMLGATSLGYYNRAYQFLMLPAQLFGTATAKVLFPSIASIQNEPERVSRAYLRALGQVAMLTLPATGLLVVIAPELVMTLFGEKWQEMIVPFQILVLSLLFRTSYKISDSISLAMGSMYQRAWRQWIYAAAVAAGTFAGYRWGLAGVAVGVSTAVMLNFLIMTNLALAITKVPTRKVIAVHLRHILIACGYSLLIWAAVTAARLQGWSDPVVLGIGLLVGLLLAALIWFGLRGLLGADGKWLEQLLRSRLPFLRSKSSDAKEAD
ncbi:lipopolysaccharide biosynthesis protein [Allopontixanthobacter sp.]|uniref:lipopolysaccharide biosynthesis protein n=1 Tax=Allopontixanthobacter sp. TaxID=2906452 RepID=UPI002AB97CE7|nr:lipopolysaccharide biosynthesis protein [Allopontixanthobacter sp.]MDZ4307953.1 lipopolysaccharide biosynthesis protein [Allopontixanthobacter sp.]